jgi:hypothetical protein
VTEGTGPLLIGCQHCRPSEGRPVLTRSSHGGWAAVPRRTRAVNFHHLRDTTEDHVATVLATSKARDLCQLWPALAGNRPERIAASVKL